MKLTLLDILQIISALGIPAALVAWINKKWDSTSKKQLELITKKFQEQDDKQKSNIQVVADRVSIIEVGVGKIESKIDSHLNDTDSKHKIYRLLKTSTIKEIGRLLTAGGRINSDYFYILTKWGKLMQSFAIDYFYEEVRNKDEIDRAEYLQKESNQIKKDFDVVLNAKMATPKLDSNLNRKRFSEFLVDTKVYGSFEILIMALERNGLDQKEYASQFRTQCNKFFHAMMTAFEVWEGMKDSKGIFANE